MYWAKTGVVGLSAGEYTIRVEQDNTTYPPKYDNKFNVSKCDLALTAVAGNNIEVLSADDYGEIGQTGTDCCAYIKKGDQLNAKKHHAINVGMEYHGTSPDQGFDGTPTSSRNQGTTELDRFKPEQVELQSDGSTRFKVWSEETDGAPLVSLNGASASADFKNAVFEDLFAVTVYYTIKESGCPGAKTTSVSCKLGDSPAKVTLTGVKSTFLRKVENEGFGSLRSPYTDKGGRIFPYIAYDRGPTTFPRRCLAITTMNLPTKNPAPAIQHNSKPIPNIAPE